MAYDSPLTSLTSLQELNFYLALEASNKFFIDRTMENLKIFFPEIFSTRKNEKFWTLEIQLLGRTCIKKFETRLMG